MPNWCEHDLYLSGPFAERERFLSPLLDGTGRVQHDFPRPPKLEESIVPIQIVETGVEADLINADRTGLAAITKEMAEDWDERFGAYEWYNWSIKHWGCK